MAVADNPTTPNEACACKRANHWHGTRACYVIDKCRCDPCRVAAVAAERVRLRHKAEAAWGYREDAYVDATGAVAHIRALQAAGLGWKEVARRAGLNPSVVYPLLYGRADRKSHAPRTRCRPATRDALLSVPIPAPEELRAGRIIDSTPTANRARALHRLGYSFNLIADAGGIDRQAVDWAINGRPVTVATHNAVAAAFAKLWDKPHRGHDWHSRAAATRARNRGEREGWPTVLDLDDDGHLLDAPEADSRGVDLDEFVFLLRAGETPEAAARRCGTSLNTVEQQMKRTARDDVRAAIAAARILTKEKVA